MSSNRQQQVNSFLSGLTQKEVDIFIDENKINVEYIKKLNKIRNSSLSKTHSQKIFDTITQKFGKEHEEFTESIYKIGQAQIVALLLNQFYDENYKVSDVKSFFKAWMDNDKDLKGYVYEIMKDY